LSFHVIPSDEFCQMKSPPRAISLISIGNSFGQMIALYRLTFAA